MAVYVTTGIWLNFYRDLIINTNSPSHVDMFVRLEPGIVGVRLQLGCLCGTLHLGNLCFSCVRRLSWC